MEPMKELSNEEIGRYSRHITLPEVGLKGQGSLKVHQFLSLVLVDWVLLSFNI